MSINFDTYSFTFLASQLEANKILFVIIACILEKKKTPEPSSYKLTIWKLMISR